MSAVSTWKAGWNEANRILCSVGVTSKGSVGERVGVASELVSDVTLSPTSFDVVSDTSTSHARCDATTIRERRTQGAPLQRFTNGAREDAFLVQGFPNLCLQDVMADRGEEGNPCQRIEQDAGGVCHPSPRHRNATEPRA